jgi:large subunit ribosomal protein L14e
VKANPMEVGRVVVSIMGHDRGRRFLVVGVADDRFVLIADGDTRKLQHPKKKQLKHLRAEPILAEELIPAIKAGAQTADSAIRKALKATAPEAQTTGKAPASGNVQAPDGTEQTESKEECALVQK